MTTAEFLPLVAIGGFAVTLATALGRFLMDYLTAKFNPPREPKPDQSDGCKSDHGAITQILITGNANVAELLKQNARALDAMNQHSHVMELRHQIMVAKIDAAEKQQRTDAQAILDRLR
jgi:hypothetical protein